MVIFSFVVCFHVSWYFDTLPPVLHLTTILIMLLFVVTGSSAKLPLLIQKNLLDSNSISGHQKKHLQKLVSSYLVA